MSLRGLFVKYILLICFILSITERTGVSIISYLLEKSASAYDLKLDQESHEEKPETENQKKSELKEFVDSYIVYSVNPSFSYFKDQLKLTDKFYLLSLFKPSVPTPPPDLFI